MDLFRLKESCRVLLIGLAGLTCLAALGCGGAHRKSQPLEQSNLKILAILYGRFLAQHRGEPPASEVEFKRFVQSLPSAELAGFGVKDPDDVFVSARDGKPYVVRYGRLQGSTSAAVIAYEQEGREEKRMVANSLGAVEDVDQARFRQLVSAAKAP